MASNISKQDLNDTFNLRDKIITLKNRSGAVETYKKNDVKYKLDLTFYNQDDLQSYLQKHRLQGGTPIKVKRIKITCDFDNTELDFTSLVQIISLFKGIRNTDNPPIDLILKGIKYSQDTLAIKDMMPQSYFELASLTIDDRYNYLFEMDTIVALIGFITSFNISALSSVNFNQIKLQTTDCFVELFSFLNKAPNLKSLGMDDLRTETVQACITLTHNKLVVPDVLVLGNLVDFTMTHTNLFNLNRQELFKSTIPNISIRNSFISDTGIEVFEKVNGSCFLKLNSINRISSFFQKQRFLVNITRLELVNTVITNNLVDTLKEFIDISKSLVSLGLSGCSLIGDKNLTLKLSSLEVLILEHMKVNSIDLRGCQHLKNLKVYNCLFDDIVLENELNKFSLDITDLEAICENNSFNYINALARMKNVTKNLPINIISLYGYSNKLIRVSGKRIKIKYPDISVFLVRSKLDENESSICSENLSTADATMIRGNADITEITTDIDTIRKTMGKEYICLSNWLNGDITDNDFEILTSICSYDWEVKVRCHTQVDINELILLIALFKYGKDFLTKNELFEKQFKKYGDTYIDINKNLDDCFYTKANNYIKKKGDSWVFVMGKRMISDDLDCIVPKELKTCYRIFKSKGGK
jgi:hypothetical protein